MDEQQLKELLQGRRSGPLIRGRHCPDELQLAAFVESELQSSDRELVEKHVADCDFCLNQISFLAQAAWQKVSGEVPASILRRARDLVPRKSESVKSWGWRWAAASAAAACIVLVIGFIALRFRNQQTVNTPSGPLVAQQRQTDLAPVPTLAPARPTATHANEKLRPSAPAAPMIRREGQDLAPAVVFPPNGATLRRRELEFRWQPFTDAAFYDLRVVTADGDLVFESKTEDTHLRVANDIRLQPGAKYFVSIRAHLRQGNTVKSGIVSFRIAAP